jgi:hypothetical protein
LIWLILIWVTCGIVFYKTASKHTMNRFIWTVLGLFSYVLSLVLGGIILAIIHPELLEEQNSEQLGELSVYIGFLGMMLTWFLLKYKIRLKHQKNENAEILDDLTK